jgi:Na+-transporting methylmalonyl-CoA/oxaloacetate decarboxylase gamma subunit
MKIFIILGILFYVVYKISSFFFRAGAASQELKNYKQQQPKPNAAPNQKNRKGRINGGEYVDYEEVK